ncbi:MULTISPECIES: hypothetical protein [Clostridium]|uniref:hypothetical protein n=1 Tax=Clostridium TaxID=1485 RepID=UPI000824382D|nr:MULTISPECIES: hypothetical protein [Clostridium]
MYKPRTVWERVFLFLKNKGIDVYSPGQHQGKCKEPYVVLKNTGTSGFEGCNKIGYQTIDILIYCPSTNYSDLEPFAQNIQLCLSELKEYIRPTGNITSVVVDTNIDAYTQIIEYQGLQKLRG